MMRSEQISCARCPPGLVPDKEVRVSVKALAVSCVGAAAALLPEAFFNALYLEPLGGVPAEGTAPGVTARACACACVCAALLR